MSAIRYIALLLSLLALTSNLKAQQDVQIRSEDGLLSIQASNVSAGTLAAELSQQLGISVVVTGDSETQVNLDIVEEPLETALGKLSPNNMLVRDRTDNEIIEIVLMMGETQNGSNGAADQFLPSGSPADEIVVDDGMDAGLEDSDLELLRDPNRAELARSAGADANAGIPAAQLPMDNAENADPLINPETGLPYEQ